MADLTITHTHTDGTLIDGTSKGDGTNTILKSAGFRWFRTLGTWGIPNSRDRQPKTHIIDRARAALEHAGHTVTIDIDNTHRDTATVEADRAQRQQDRADALDAKAARRHDQADAAWQRHHDATAALPPFGEPVHVGHHSERRHRNALDKAWNSIGTAVHAQNDADEADRRAQVASRTTEHRYNPVTVANRIDKLDAEQRADQRRLDGHTRTVANLPGGQKLTETTTAATGDYRQAITERMAQRADDLAYWRAVRADQIATGDTGNYSRDTIATGDQVKIRFHGWVPVLRVNAKTVSVETPAPYGGRMIRGTIPYQEIQDHRPHTDNNDDTTDTP